MTNINKKYTREVLKKIPSIDELLHRFSNSEISVPIDFLKFHLNQELNLIRNDFKKGLNVENPSSYIEERIDDFNIYTFDIVYGGVSDEYGKFFIDQIPIGEYQVKVKYIGYEIHVIDAVAILPPDKFIIDVGTIEISPILLKMKEVSVYHNTLGPWPKHVNKGRKKV